ncbi:MAG: adenylate/guanylate cyclase domain-containing protein [Actinomycetia bacterium]|nr:adenylate/guanylate cyclase domain-containing protein [Actinomycetes bacterium]
MQAPRTRFASCGDTDIAYQVVGDGPTDLLVFSGPPIPVDSVDDDPSMFRFHRRLASFSRLIRFDQRGEGSSSPAPLDAVGPEQWAQDALSVLDAVGSEQATVFASVYFAASAFILAAEHPERVRGLVIVNGAARTMWAPDYPAGAREGATQQFSTVGLDPDAVEKGFDALRVVAPSVADDSEFRKWWDMAGNRAASPSMARVLHKILAEVDVRDSLEQITAPTLLISRAGSEFVPVGHGRYLAEHIAGSRYVELDGTDALYWVGDTAAMLDEIEEFITGARGGFDTERVLTTIVFTDIVGSTERAAALGDDHWRHLLDQHDRIVRRELARFRGREVNTAGDGFVVTFNSPSVAIDCAEAIVDAVREIGVEVRVGMHAGEVEVRGSDIAGMAVHIAARVASRAGPGQVLVSSTVREIVTGSRRTFTDAGEYQLKGVPGRWRLHSPIREAAPISQ